MINSVAREYAKVLFDMNLDYEYVATNIKNVIEIFKDEEINKFFKHPKVDLSEKKKILEESIKLEKKELLYFFFVLLDNKRIDLLEDIYSSYSEMVDEKLNIGRFIVYTSFKLSDEYLNKLKLLLMKEYNKKVIIDIKLDENLIGGIVIKYKNTIINDSIIEKLDDLKKKILGN